MNTYHKIRAIKILGAYVNPPQPSVNFEKGGTKGEGSRGGKVIGHTRSGKAIYDTFDHPDHKGFSKEDHADAYLAHDHAEAETEKDMKGGRMPMMAGRNKMKHHAAESIKHGQARGKTKFTQDHFTFGNLTVTRERMEGPNGIHKTLSVDRKNEDGTSMSIGPSDPDHKKAILAMMNQENGH